MSVFSIYLRYSLKNVNKVRKKTENSIREESFRKGSEHEKIEIAKSMLNKSMEINLISEITGLSLEEINNLKNQLIINIKR